MPANPAPAIATRMFELPYPTYIIGWYFIFFNVAVFAPVEQVWNFHGNWKSMPIPPSVCPAREWLLVFKNAPIVAHNWEIFSIG
jgi:hypothetical protein